MATTNGQQLAQQLRSGTSAGQQPTQTGTSGQSGGIDTSGGITSSSAGINSPSVNIQGNYPKSQAGLAAFSDAQKLALQGDFGDQTRTAVGTLAQQQNLAQAQKGLQGLSFAKSLGSVKQQIAQNQFENREKLAQSGFIGSGAQDRNTVATNQQIDNTLTSKEDQFTNSLRNLNANIINNRQAELQTLSGSGALERGVVNQALRSGQDIFTTESDQGFFGHLAGLFGKDQTASGRIDENKFKANTKVQDLMSELGINPNSADSLAKLNDAAKQAITTRRGSSWDLSTDINVDLGDGPVKVDEQHMSIGQAFTTEFLNLVQVGGLGAMVIPGVGQAISSASSAASEALGGAVSTSIEGVMDGVTSDIAATMGDIASSIPAASLDEIVSAGGGAVATEAGATSGATIAGSIANTITENAASTVGTATTMTEEATNSLANSIGTAIEAELGDAVESLPASAVGAASNVASDTLEQLMTAMAGNGAGLSPQLLEAIQNAGFQSVSDLTMEDAVSIATSSAMDIIGNADIVSTMAEATAEAGTGVGETATTTSAEAAAGNVGQVATATGGEEAGAAGTTAEGEAAQAPARGFGRAKNLLTKWRGAAKTTPTTGRGLAARAAKGVAKLPAKIAWNAAKNTVLTDLGALGFISSATANEIQGLVDKARKSGMSDEEAARIGDALVSQEQNK